MEQRCYERNDVAEGLMNILHALVIGLSETGAMPTSVSVDYVRAWADFMEHVTPGGKRFMHDVADAWDAYEQPPARPRLTVIQGGKTEDRERDDDDAS